MPNEPTVVPVEHGGDAIEAEAVHVVLPDPPGQVGQEVPQHLVLRVVEAEGVPLPVHPLFAAVRVQKVGAVQLGQTLLRVLAEVRVDDVQKHQDPLPVALVHQPLEVIRLSVA